MIQTADVSGFFLISRYQSMESVYQQIIAHVAPGTTVSHLGTCIIRIKNNRTTVWNLAMNTMNGRNKLLKYLLLVPGLSIHGNSLDATVSVVPTNPIPIVDFGTTRTLISV